MEETRGLAVKAMPLEIEFQKRSFVLQRYFAVLEGHKAVKHPVTVINANVRPFSYIHDMTTKTFGYARVSTADQNPTSQENA